MSWIAVPRGSARRRALPRVALPRADGRTAYVSDYGSGAYHTITPVDLVRQQALPAIDLGPLADLAATPDGWVSVVDLRSLAVVGRVRAGREPDGLAWADRP